MIGLCQGRIGPPVAMVFLVGLTAHGWAGEIHDAAHDDDLTRVKKLLANNPALVRAVDGNHRTPLHLAVEFSSKELVAYLLANGAEVNARCYNQFTPLHLTSDPEIAELLIDHGADLTAEAVGRTPLQDAVAEHNLPLMNVLLAEGQELDFELLVELGRIKEVAAMLKDKPWLAKSPRTCLHTACGNGDLEMAKLLLAHGADPDLDYGFSNVFGRYSPLSDAVNGGHYEVAKLLCDHGATMDVAGGKLHESLFHFAVEQLAVRFVELMLEHGADVDSQDHMSPMTPLHIAATIGDVEKARLLIEFGADVNARTPDGATPTLFAATRGQNEVSEFLLSKGAELDIVSACALGKRDAVTKLLQADGGLVNARDKEWRRYPLLWAARTGDADLIRLLVDKGADVNSRAPRTVWASYTVTETALHVAAESGNVSAARALIERGAKIDAKDDEGCRPLHRASLGGHAEVVDLLLEMGVDPNAVDGGGSTPIHYARNSLAVAMRLVDAKARLDVRDHSGETSLAVAARSGKKEVAELLVRHGAPVDIFSACILGRTALVQEMLEENPGLIDEKQGVYPQQTLFELAAEHGHEDVVRLLLDKKTAITDLWPPLLLAARHGHLPIVKLLLASGSDAHRRANLALHAAAEGDHPELVRFLLCIESDPEARGRSRLTPLMSAASQGAARVAKVLIDANVSVDVRDENGETALHHAAWGGHAEVVELLLKAGADVNARDHRGETALFEADQMTSFFPVARDSRGSDHSTVAQLLRAHGASK